MLPSAPHVQTRELCRGLGRHAAESVVRCDTGGRLADTQRLEEALYLRSSLTVRTLEHVPVDLAPTRLAWAMPCVMLGRIQRYARLRRH